jgi:hypothetical protein
MTNYDIIYDIIHAMGKLNFNKSYKIFKNGTIMLEYWDEEDDYPRLDTILSVGDGLNMFFQSDSKTGKLGCHMLSREKDINNAQNMLNDDLSNDAVVFDSKTDDIKSKMVIAYILASSDIRALNHLVNISCQSMKMITDHHHDKCAKNDDYDDKPYSIWDGHGAKIKVFHVPPEDLEDIGAVYDSLRITSNNKSNKNYGKAVSLIITPNFMDKMPDIAKYKVIC